MDIQVPKTHRMRIGREGFAVRIIVDDQDLVVMPWKQALEVAQCIREKAKEAESFERLFNEKEREQLYSDHELMIKNGLTNLNLGIPAGDHRKMRQGLGNIKSEAKVGRPSIVPTKE